MAKPKERVGEAHDNAVYEMGRLAAIFGRNREWALDHILDEGCPAVRIGNLYFASGASFREWIETRAVSSPRSERRRRKTSRE